MIEPTIEQMRAELAASKAELEALKAKKTKEITFKVSEKGGVSVYGLGRFPVTLYQEQWIKLIHAVPALEEFIAANLPKLKTRD